MTILLPHVLALELAMLEREERHPSFRAAVSIERGSEESLITVFKGSLWYDDRDWAEFCGSLSGDIGTPAKLSDLSRYLTISVGSDSISFTYRRCQYLGSNHLLWYSQTMTQEQAAQVRREFLYFNPASSEPQ